MKKLTAGIFTALLGLVTVNAANAAIPSTSYVDAQIGAAKDYAVAQDTALESAITTAYEAADATLKSGYEAADTALGGRIDGVVTAYQQADTALDGRVDTLETKVGSGDMTVSGTAQADVIAAINALDTKTNGIASEGALTALQETVAGHTTSITNLQTADSTNLQAAKDYADGLATNYDAAGSAATAESNAKAYADGLAVNYDEAGAAADALAAAQTYADGLNTAADGRLDVLEAKDITLNTAIETNKAAIESNDRDITALQTKDTELADLISDNEEDIAQNAADIAQNATDIATKAAKAGYTASQVVVTDSNGAIATAAQIPNTQVSGLGDLAIKSTIANADVADGAAIAQSKIDGLTDALAGKMPVRAIATDTISEAGTYVLTATQEENGVINYTWELIDRVDGGQA